MIHEPLLSCCISWSSTSLLKVAYAVSILCLTCSQLPSMVYKLNPSHLRFVCAKNSPMHLQDQAPCRVEHHISKVHALARKPTAVLHTGTCIGNLWVSPSNSLGEDTVSYSLSWVRSAIPFTWNAALEEVWQMKYLHSFINHKWLVWYICARKCREGICNTLSFVIPSRY